MIVNTIELLTDPRNYYVDPQNGSDAFDGLTEATAFATPQKAADVACALASHNQPITVNFLAGTYTGLGFTVKPSLCGPDWVLSFIGESAASVQMDSALVADCFVSNITFNQQIKAERGLCYLDSVRAHLFEIDRQSTVDMSGCQKFAVGTNQGGHCAIKASGNSKVVVSGMSVTGTPDHDIAFVIAEEGSVVRFVDQPTGTATGKRFLVKENAVIKGTGLSSNFLPGDVSGDEESGGRVCA